MSVVHNILRVKRVCIFVPFDGQMSVELNIISDSVRRGLFQLSTSLAKSLGRDFRVVIRRLPE